MIYGNRWTERPICAILPLWQDAHEGRAYALRGTSAKDRAESPLCEAG